MKSMKLNSNKIIALGDEVVADVGYSSAPMKDTDAEAEGENQDRYPYSLRLFLEDETLEMLGLEQLPDLNAVMKMDAKVKVVGIRQDEHGKSLCIQITDMELKPAKSVEQSMYPSLESE